MTSVNRQTRGRSLTRKRQMLHTADVQRINRLMNSLIWSLYNLDSRVTNFTLCNSNCKLEKKTIPPLRDEGVLFDMNRSIVRN